MGEGNGLKDYEFLTITLEHGIASMRLEDPMVPDFQERKHPMHRELRDVWHDLTYADEVEAVVLTGAGASFFPGPTLEAILEMVKGKPSVAIKQMGEAAQIVREVLEFEKPFVAAVNGQALGIGAVIAFLADATVASRDAVFWDTHIRMGLTAGDGGAWLWPTLVGYGLARNLVLRSHPLNAEKAHQLGLVSELVEADDVLPKALEVASKLQRLPRYPFISSKRALKQGLRLQALMAGDLSAAQQTAAYMSPAFEEALERAIAKNQGVKS